MVINFSRKKLSRLDCKPKTNQQDNISNRYLSKSIFIYPEQRDLHFVISPRFWGSLGCPKLKFNRKSQAVKLLKSDSLQPYSRMIRVYEKNGDRLIQEFPLLNVQLKELQELFHESSDSLMFECYTITPAHIDFFQRKLNQNFDLEAYDYFLDCD